MKFDRWAVLFDISIVCSDYFRFEVVIIPRSLIASTHVMADH